MTNITNKKNCVPGLQLLCSVILQPDWSWDLATEGMDMQREISWGITRTLTLSKGVNPRTAIRSQLMFLSLQPKAKALSSIVSHVIQVTPFNSQFPEYDDELLFVNPWGSDQHALNKDYIQISA